jgi:hypothetical protein
MLGARLDKWQDGIALEEHQVLQISVQHFAEMESLFFQKKNAMIRI